MKLSDQELKIINDGMKKYRIKYITVYNEILDHVISAVEEKRSSGDNNNIEQLFTQIIEEHFGGAGGMEKLVAKQGEIYKESIKVLWMQSLKYYLTWPILGFTIISMVLGFKLPDSELIKQLIFIVSIILACSPTVFAYFLFRSRVMSTTDGRFSFLKAHLIKRASIPAVIFFNLLYLLSPAIINKTPGVILVGLMMMFVLLNLASIHFCRRFMAAHPITR